MLLMIFPTATTRNSCLASASTTASVCPGLAVGTRFPYPTVVIVTKPKNRSWLSLPSPAGPKNGTLNTRCGALVRGSQADGEPLPAGHGRLGSLVRFIPFHPIGMTTLR